MALLVLQGPTQNPTTRCQDKGVSAVNKDRQDQVAPRANGLTMTQIAHSMVVLIPGDSAARTSMVKMSALNAIPLFQQIQITVVPQDSLSVKVNAVKGSISLIRISSQESSPSNERQEGIEASHGQDSSLYVERGRHEGARRGYYLHEVLHHVQNKTTQGREELDYTHQKNTPSLKGCVITKYSDSNNNSNIDTY